MKYGLLFALVGAILTAAGVRHGGWYWVSAWPALNCLVISGGYLGFGPAVFGKTKLGRLPLGRTVVLAPFLVSLWTTWRILRAVKSEPAFDRINDKLIIGRRLLSHEFPEGIDHVVDLTCEFNEPKACQSADYHSFQILDAFVPDSDDLRRWVQLAANFSGTVYVHCAEGHGRTGLFAAALILKHGHVCTAEEAIQLLQSHRPLVQLGPRQRIALDVWLSGENTPKSKSTATD